MKKIIILILSVAIICFACKNEEKKKPESNVLIDQFLTEVENQYENQENIKNETEDTVEYYYEDGEDSLYEDEEIDSSGYFTAFFESASLLEGEIGLHFIEDGTGKNIDFYTIDIDPVKEGLFTYKEIEGSFFPELVPNPEIKDVAFKLYWKIETRHIGLADEDMDVKVLKSIEQSN